MRGEALRVGGLAPHVLLLRGAARLPGFGQSIFELLIGQGRQMSEGVGEVLQGIDGSASTFGDDFWAFDGCRQVPLGARGVGRDALSSPFCVRARHGWNGSLTPRFSRALFSLPCFRRPA